MRYLEAGTGWPVVLLHAFPLSAAMWRPQLDRVPDGWRFIAPELADLPPEGGSHESKGGSHATTIDDYASAVHILLDELRIDTAVIGGLSMGGYVAFAMYRQEPERFSGVVLADTRPQADTPEGRAGRERMRRLLARDGVRAVADEMLPHLLSAHALQDDDITGTVRALIEAVPEPAVDAALAAMMTRPDSSSLLPRMSCPALVVVGEEDAVTPPSDAAAMQQRLPRSTLTVIPGAGHLSSVEAPDEFSKALENFLRAHL